MNDIKMIKYKNRQSFQVFIGLDKCTELFHLIYVQCIYLNLQKQLNQGRSGEIEKNYT